MTGEGKNQGNGREQSGQLLSELGGIDEAKRIQAREQTNLDNLLELERPFIECYVKGTDEIRARSSQEDCDTTVYASQKERFIFNSLFLEFKKRLEGISFTETDLAAYIDAGSSDRDPNLSDHELKGRGIYSGFLLNLLTQRRENEGKELVFHIDGKGGRFDYLFALAQNVNELYIENFRGNRICHYLGYKGRIGKLVVRNIKGRFTCSGLGIGSNSDKIVCANISGDVSPLNSAFADAHFNVLMLSNIGDGIVLDDTRVSSMDFTGGLMICDNISTEIFYRQKLYIAELGLVVLNNIKKKQIEGISHEDITYIGFDDSHVDTILFNNVPEDFARQLNSLFSVSIPNVYSPQDEEYELGMRQYKMPEIIELLKKLREGEKDMRTFMAEFDKIYSIVEPRIRALTRK